MLPGDDFYLDLKWCERCGEYGRYLRSIHANFCAECGARVSLFSGDDHRRFQAGLRRERPRFGTGDERESA